MKKITILLVLILCASGCAHTPEAMKDAIYTEVAQTIEAQFTQTAAAQPPTSTPTNIPTPTETSKPTQAVIILPPTQPAMQTAPTQAPEPSRDNPYKVEVISAGPMPNQFVPEQSFTLTFQLKNVGTAIWSGKYKFYHRNGAQIGNQSSYAINDVINPGGILNIAIPATAPKEKGTYQTEWVFATPEGIVFYYVYYNVIVGDTTFITEQPTAINPTATPNSFDWMCTDSERSKIQGNGCQDYCFLNGTNLSLNGKKCYADGNEVTNFH